MSPLFFLYGMIYMGYKQASKEQTKAYRASKNPFMEMRIKIEIYGPQFLEYLEKSVDKNEEIIVYHLKYPLFS